MGVLRKLARGTALVGAVVTGGALAVTAKSILATPQPLESALEGESRIFRFRSGDVFYKVRGPQGAQPVLLLHGIHLGASSFEWRKNFGELSQGFRVFAPDLPGFGLSDRPAIEYTGELYAQFVSDFAREIVRQPMMLVARGHSAAFAVKAAALDEALFNRLVLLSPSGIVPSLAGAGRGAEAHDGQGGMLEALQAPLRRLGVSSAGQVPYALLTNKPAVTYLLLRQSYANREQIDPTVLPHLYATTHQYGARFAPLAFMGGKLDIDVENAFSMLSQPVLLVWGQQDMLNSPLNAGDLHLLNPRARLEVLSNAGNAVQEERARDINELLRAWFLAPSDLVDPSRLDRASVAPASLPAMPLPEEPPDLPSAPETPAMALEEEVAASTPQAETGETEAAEAAASTSAPPAASARGNGQAAGTYVEAPPTPSTPQAPPPAAAVPPQPPAPPAATPAPPPAAGPGGAAKGQRHHPSKAPPARAARPGGTSQPDAPRQEPLEPGRQPPPRPSGPKKKR